MRCRYFLSRSLQLADGVGTLALQDGDQVGDSLAQRAALAYEIDGAFLL